MTVSLADTVVGRGEPSTNSQSAPKSPVAKKHSIDRPIRTEIAESITDWANRTGAI